MSLTIINKHYGSKEIIKGNIKEGDTVDINVNGEEFTFNPIRKMEA